jgi:hypothetical protein
LPLISPPGALYVSRDDRLFVRARNSVASLRLELWVRQLLPNGTVQPSRFHFAPATDRSADTEVFDLAEGWLLSVTILPTGATPRRGQTFAEVFLARGREADIQLAAQLVSSYVTTGGTCSWPWGRQEDSTEGPGFMRVFAGTDPAAGVEVIETVPTDARWRIHGFRGRLVTDATAATRQVFLQYIEGGASLLMNPAGAGQTASLTRDYNGAAYGVVPALADDELYIPIPGGLWLNGGATVRTLTVNLQAGDNWGLPIFYVEELIED